MRISNKISINGDTLLIFEQKTEMQLKQIAMQIYKELSRKFSGGSYDVMDELEAMKKAGILDSEEQNIISTYLREFGDENNPINQNIFEAPSMEEGSFNPMKSKKLYYHVLEDGGYGRIGHQGYYNTKEEAKQRAEKLSDMFPKSSFYVEAYPSKREPVTVTMEEGSDESLNEAKEKKAPADKKKADKTNYGNKDMSDVDMVNPYELKKGIRIEMVDTEDYEKAMDKVVKKLKKDPMFYSNLIANAKETKGKRADVPTEVKDKKLNKVSDKMKDKANEMEVSKKDATKKNANDSLNKKEKMSGKPKGVKEMTMTPKKSKGMKSMDVPGKEKKTNLKESFNLWDSFKKNILR
jgi:hypothetical protein